MANMYGYNTSSAYKLDENDRRMKHAQRNDEIAKEESRRRESDLKRKNAARRRAFLKVGVCFAIAFVIVGRYVAINEANSKISELKKEYNSIVAANQDLQAKIDKSIDLKKLQTVANEKFGMVRPERYQMFYVDMQLADHAENVAKEKADDVKEKVAVMGVPGTIISAMKMFK